MKADSKFLNKYKKEMTDIMLKINPDLDKKEVESVVLDLIKENVSNPKVTLDNNYTGEMRETTLLSVLDWTYERNPIICGNAAFYKNQHEAINPIAKMLEDFLTQRKIYKKNMFKVEDSSSPRYKDLDRLQMNEKINANSYYGASGAPSSAFYSKYSGASTTHSAQQVISTAENLFEGFLVDNYYFLNLTELIEWMRKVLNEFKDSGNYVHDFIEQKSIYDVEDRLLKKILDKSYNDEIILEQYLQSLSTNELTILYYKNNLMEFIKDHDYIKSIIYAIFTNVENLEYAKKEDKEWFINVVPEEYRQEMLGKSYKDWNNFVNTKYFMNPNDVPESIIDPLFKLKEYLVQYVYCRYLSMDRIYRLKNFKRKVVTVIDTDSNILSLDTVIDFIMDEVVQDNTFGRKLENNIFICVNMLAYVLTDVVTDILLTFGEHSNIPEEFRPIYNMKNEFFMSRLIIGLTKKRYISKIVLREGNLMNPPKQDIKGFDFKKSSCSEYAEKVYMGLLKKYVIDSEQIDLVNIHKELKEFKESVKQSIERGERTYLPNGSAKEIAAYKLPEQEQSVRGVLAWNFLNPNNTIDLPAKVSLLKLNIFDEEDIVDLKDKYPEYYNIIMDKIFNDTTGLFITKSIIYGIDYVNPNAKDWYEHIPKKFQSKYKKLGPIAWNHFVEQVADDASENYDIKMYEKWKKDINTHYEYKKRGMQVIAIPSNATIPEWIQPYIDYATMINNIIAPFIPVLDIFKMKTVEEGRQKKGVNRKTEAFTNIVKF